MSGIANPHVLLVVAVTLGFLVLHGALWSTHPTPGVWLAGSILLGLLWGVAFMRVITRGTPNA